MKIKVTIDCETINEFHAHLTGLAKQVKKSARKQKLNPSKDEFQPEDADSLSDNNCYGTHDVLINLSGDTIPELREEVKELILKLLPAEEYGENYEAERLWDLITLLL